MNLLKYKDLDYVAELTFSSFFKHDFIYIYKLWLVIFLLQWNGSNSMVRLRNHQLATLCHLTKLYISFVFIRLTRLRKF